MPPLLLALAVAAAAEPAALGGPLREGVERALAVPGARVEVLSVEGAPPAGCAVVRATVPRAIPGSCRSAVLLEGSDAAGRPCQAWVWAWVRVKVPTLVTTRAVGEGEPLAEAVTSVERELAPGRSALATLPAGALAARALSAGTLVDPPSIRVGPRPGEPVTVALRAGALVVEQQGRSASCRRGRACALLPSGRRVEGDWHEGRILLGSP
jgi:hypothetical protein